MNRFILSAEARLDFIQAFDFIDNYSARAADQWE